LAVLTSGWDLVSDTQIRIIEKGAKLPLFYFNNISF